jgi:hypothetical protein
MSTFEQVISKLYEERPSNINYGSFMVEAVFANPDVPSGGMYSTLGIFHSGDEAQQYAIGLAQKLPFDFLTYRVRKIGIFNDFFSKDVNTLTFTEDEKFNESILKHERAKNEFAKAQIIKEKLLQDQLNNEDIDGSNEKVARLLYLCVKLNKDVIDNNKLFEESSKNLKIRTDELKHNVSINSGEWMDYVKKSLTMYNEPSSTIENMMTWWESNK